jgi:hypothetical protein
MRTAISSLGENGAMRFSPGEMNFLSSGLKAIRAVTKLLFCVCRTLPIGGPGRTMNETL